MNIPKLSELEVLKAIVQFQIKIDWSSEVDEGDEGEDSDQPVDYEVSIFPTATGGTWFQATFYVGPDETFEVAKMNALTEVVSQLVYCASLRTDDRGSINGHFLDDKEDDELSL